MGKPTGGGGFQASSFKFKTNDLMLETNHKGLFVDASRNAAVSAGDRDLKSDVRDKKLREKYEYEFRNIECIVSILFLEIMLVKSKNRNTSSNN